MTVTLLLYNVKLSLLIFDNYKVVMIYTLCDLHSSLISVLQTLL